MAARKYDDPAQRVSKISFLPREDKSPMLKPPCNDSNVLGLVV